MRYHATLRYPVFLAEAGNNEFTIYDVLHRQGDFLTLGRVPVIGRYGTGLLFDSAGRVFAYEGAAGWPRFGKGTKAVLEALMLPGLLMKPVAVLRYYGPELRSVRAVEEAAFREMLFEAIKRHLRPKDRQEVRALLDKAQGPEAMIRAIDHWRYFGGKRDRDGHPLDEDAFP